MGFGLTMTIERVPYSRAAPQVIADATEVAMQATLADAVLLATRPPAEGGAPRDTGRLANSITFRVFRRGDRVDGFLGIFDAAVHYALYQELGTRRIRPKLFLRRAWEQAVPRLPDRVRQLTGAL